MCIAILKLPNGTVTSEQLARGFSRNRDGGGFAYVKDGKVIVNKGHMQLKDFIAAYEAALESAPDSKFLIHFRIATAGKITADNTHPFKLRGGALIHNGSFFWNGYEAEKSDTRIVAEKLDETLLTKSDWFLSKSNLEQAVSYNKVVVLFDDGDHLILNEKGGDWIDNVWYSNSSCQALAGFPTVASAPSATSYYSRMMDMYDD